MSNALALGWAGLAAAGLLTLALIRLEPAARGYLTLAFVLRAGAVLVHNYVIPLPDSFPDADRFAALATEWSKGPWSHALEVYPGTASSHIYTWLASLLFRISGPSAMLLQSVSVMLGLINVLVGARLCAEFWDAGKQRAAGYALAAFPTLVLYSALSNRESVITLFLTATMLYAVRWARSWRFPDLAIAVAYLLCAALFHGALVVPAAMLVALGAVIYAWRALLALSSQPFLAARGLLIATACTAAVLATSQLSVSKLGNLIRGADPDYVTEQISMRTYSSFGSGKEGGAYPDWTIPEDDVDLLWAIPVRVIYFVASPFPWDVRRPMHVLGVADGLTYILILCAIVFGRPSPLHREGLWLPITLLLVLIAAFGTGTGNFGPAIRHRAKLVTVLIALAVAPLLSVWRVRRNRSRNFSER